MTGAQAVAETETGEFPIPANTFAEKVVMVEHYTDRLFRFRITRPRSFRFRSGEFVMIGLPNETGKPILRAYSIASPFWGDELEFYSIKVPDGPLTEHLQKIKVGDTVLMKPKSTGTLVVDALLPGKRLFMLSTGTGISSFFGLLMPCSHTPGLSLRPVSSSVQSSYTLKQGRSSSGTEGTTFSAALSSGPAAAASINSAGAGTPGTPAVPPAVPLEPTPLLGGTSGTSGTPPNR